MARLDAKREALRSLDLDDPPAAMYDVLNFFEHMSLLTNNGYLDRRMVWSEFGYWMFDLYADARPLIDSEQRDDPAMFHELSTLMEQMRTIEGREAHGSQDHPGPDDLLASYQNEASGESAPKGHGHRGRPAAGR